MPWSTLNRWDKQRDTTDTSESLSSSDEDDVLMRPYTGLFPKDASVPDATTCDDESDTVGMQSPQNTRQECHNESCSADESTTDSDNEEELYHHVTSDTSLHSPHQEN